MRKLLNSLKYSDRETKIYLWSMILLSAATVIFGLAAVFLLSFACGTISVVCAVIAALIFQNTSVKELDFEALEEIEKQETAKKELITEEEALASEKEKKALELLEAEQKEKERKELIEEAISRVEHYTEKQVVQIMHKHKVKRDNRKVMIDLCSTFRIRQSPAYFWVEGGKANFLVLEEEARTIQIPLNKIKEITYERGVMAQTNCEYTDFKTGSFVAQVFKESMPTYYKAMKNGKQGYFKNLYSITPDLKVTNTSARALFDLLKLDFGIYDAVTNSPRYNEYYKMAYKANVLWKDQVINTEEYRERIKEIFLTLKEVGISGSEYDELTEQMVEGKLITREYGEYYKKL